MDEFVRNRITQLRINKGISEYQLSYDLGHSRGYINNISSGDDDLLLILTLIKRIKK